MHNNDHLRSTFSDQTLTELDEIAQAFNIAIEQAVDAIVNIWQEIQAIFSKSAQELLDALHDIWPEIQIILTDHPTHTQATGKAMLGPKLVSRRRFGNCQRLFYCSANTEHTIIARLHPNSLPTIQRR